MKKLFLIIAIAVLGTASAAAQMSVYAGYANTKYTHTMAVTDISDTYSVNYAFVGVSYDVPFKTAGKGFGFNTGAFAYFGGYKEDIETYNECRINIPLCLTYTIPVSVVSVSLYGGCGLNCGILGKSVETVGSISTTTDWYKDDYNRFVVTAEAGAAFTFFDNYSLYAGLYHSLNDLSKIETFTEKSLGFEIGLGYSF